MLNVVFTVECGSYHNIIYANNYFSFEKGCRNVHPFFHSEHP